MNLKSAGLVALAVGTLTTAGLSSITPQSPAEQQQQRIDEVGRMQEKVNRTRREQGMELGDAEQRDRLRPVEPRPPEDIRLRLPRFLP